MAEVVIELVKRGDWAGTASDLLGQIATPGNWGVPRTPQHLSESLRRLVPYLREEGIEVVFRREGHESTRRIYIKRTK